MVFIPVLICHKLVQKQQVSDCETVKLIYILFSYSRTCCTGVPIVIRGRYVPLIWTVNREFADQKTYFDWK